MAPKDAKEKESLAYLDLLASTLTQHEKTLDRLIEKLEKASSELSKLTQEKGEDQKVETKREGQKVETKISAVQARAPEIITYVKIEINRPIEEITEILETLTSKSPPRQP
jgi:uncharacterized coiled-coil protein SlyX